MSGASAVYATFSPVAATGIAKVGSIGLVSQSGAFGGFAYSLARERGLGLSHWVTTGNEVDIELADCLDWLVDDDATKVILAYMEGCRDGAKLLRALDKARAAKKPVVIVKVGPHRARRRGGGLAHGGAGRRRCDLRCRVQAVWRLARGHDRRGLRRRLCGVGRGRCARNVDRHADRVRRRGRDDGRCRGEPRVSTRSRCRRRHRSRSSRACRLRRRATRSMSPGRSTSDQEVMPLAYRLMLEDGDYDSLVVFQSAAGLSARGTGAGAAGRRHAREVSGPGDRRVQPVHAGAAQKLDEGQVLAFADPSRAVRAIAALASYATTARASGEGGGACRRSSCRAAR